MDTPRLEPFPDLQELRESSFETEETKLLSIDLDKLKVSISTLISSGAKILCTLKDSVFPVPASSSQGSQPSDHSDGTAGYNLEKLRLTLKRIDAVLRDAEQRVIIDESVKLWLKELKLVAYDAHKVLTEYEYKLTKAEVELRNGTKSNPRKRKEREEIDVSSHAPYPEIVTGDMVDRIREIRERFDEIANDRDVLYLREEDGQRRTNFVRRLAPTSHLIIEENIVGRETEKEKIVDLLFQNSCNAVPISVMCITGIGGLGKTTLTQFVYNCKRVQEHFDLFGWVHVCKDLEIVSLTGRMMESITKSSCNFMELSTLQTKLQEEIEGKKVFVVLDDVWNVTKTLWNLLIVPFKSASKASFIVTTRNSSVAQTVQTMPPFEPSYLPEEACWLLFKHYAFGDIHFEARSYLVKIGWQIMKKCGGLPLAVKSIANLLRCKRNEESWVEILESNLWESDTQDEIYGPLQISYDHLPAHLRPCFTYCCMFPKGTVYIVDKLVELWIAQGYVKSNGSKPLEKIGFEYAVELRERSFFDRIDQHHVDQQGEQWTMFKIHDIIHGLAQKNSEKECCSIQNGAELPKDVNVVCHLYMEVDYGGYIDHPLEINLPALRTLLVTSKCRGSTDVFKLSNTQSLRALKIGSQNSKCRLLDLGNQTQLRYLGLDCSLFGSLPSAIFSFYNLERLCLSLRDSVIELEGIGNLIKLKSLVLSRCTIGELSKSISSLSNLETLNIKSCILYELPDSIGELNCLRELKIHDCPLEFFPKSFCKLQNLKTLKVTNCNSLTELPSDFGDLSNLWNLRIQGTKIMCLPPSFSKFPSFSNMHVELAVTEEHNSGAISWLKGLTNLKGTLAICHLKRNNSLIDAHNANLKGKRYIQKLILNWEDHRHPKKEENWEDHLLFSDERSILHLSLSSVGKTYDSKNDFATLEILEPHPDLKCLHVISYRGATLPRWTADPHTCGLLQELSIVGCCNITSLPFSKLNSLRKLCIVACHSLTIIHGKSLPHALQDLLISQCHHLTFTTGLHNLASLTTLEITRCPNIEALLMEEGEFHPEMQRNHCPGFSVQFRQMPHMLRKMELNGCSKLHTVAQAYLPSELSNLEISDCPRLQKWCSDQRIKYTMRREHFGRTNNHTAEGSETGNTLGDGIFTEITEEILSF